MEKNSWMDSFKSKGTAWTVDLHDQGWRTRGGIQTKNHDKFEFYFNHLEAQIKNQALFHFKWNLFLKKSRMAHVKQKNSCIRDGVKGPESTIRKIKLILNRSQSHTPNNNVTHESIYRQQNDWKQLFFPMECLTLYTYFILTYTTYPDTSLGAIILRYFFARGWQKKSIEKLAGTFTRTWKNLAATATHMWLWDGKKNEEMEKIKFWDGYVKKGDIFIFTFEL